MFGFLKKIFADDSTALVDALRQGASIIDVRSADEFSSGSVAGAINIAHTDISKAKKIIAKLNQPIIVCCASGMRSSMAMQDLNKMGFDQVINGKTWNRVQQLQQSV